MTERHDIKAKIDAAVAQLSPLTAYERVRWATYFIEALDSLCLDLIGTGTEDTNEDVLVGIANAIEDRLNAGSW